VEQAKNRAGEFVGVIETGRRHWEDFVEFRDVVARLKPGERRQGDITIVQIAGSCIGRRRHRELVYEQL